MRLNKSRDNSGFLLAPWEAERTELGTVESPVGTLDADFVGTIDKVKNGKIHGWVYVPNGTPKAPMIALLDSEEELIRFVPSKEVDGLADIESPSARFAFSLELPERLFDGLEHSFSLQCVGAKEPIANSQKRIALTQYLASRGPSQIQGRLVGVRGILAQGWAYDANDPDEPLIVEVLDRDRPIARGMANLLREDSAAPMDGKTDCGFRIRIPNAYLDGRELQLSVRDATSGVPIESPSERLPAPHQPGWSARIADLEGQTLTGHVEIESADADEDIELELWIDGIWADRFHVPQTGRRRDLIPFRHEIPDSVPDGNIWTSVLDGEVHEFVLTPADASLAMAVAEFPTPVKSFTYGAFQTNPAGELGQLPRFVRRFVARAATSALFDGDFYSAQVRRDFPTAEHAVLDYLSDRKNWRHATSPWVDVGFITALAGEQVRDLASPLEWYLRQRPELDVGPNPLFSNADYGILAGNPANGRPERASYFDDWLEAATGPDAVNPCALVDLDHVNREAPASPAPKGERVLHYLQSWLQTKPKDRPLDTLGPYFDSDWLEQCFLLRHNRPKGCLFSAFRLGRLADQSPHPVLQTGRDGRDYYALIRNYELLSCTNAIDDITRVCPEIDAGAFYAQFPPQLAGSLNPRVSRSSFYRYLTTPADIASQSFVQGLDDRFVANEYAGIVEYCTRERGIADINRIWSRWLRLLGVPGNYSDAVCPDNGLLTVQDLNDLRTHKSPHDRGVRASLIIPTYGRDDLVLRCVLSALQAGNVDQVEIVIAEDAAHVDAGWILGYFLPYATIYKNAENLGFLLSCTEAVARSAGEIVILVNNDVIVHKGAIGELLQTFDTHHDAAVVGGLVLNADGSIQENSGLLWKDASAWNYHRGWKRADEYAFNIRESDYVSGCWIGIRRTAWDRIGGFDRRYVPAYYEESDFCLSAWQQGYKVYVNPLSLVTHLDGATMGQDEDDPASLKSHQKINRRKFEQKWKPLLEATFNENGKPTVFHTGRNNPKRFISLIFDHYIPEPDRDAGSRTMYVVCQALAAMKNNYVIFIPANNHRSNYAADLERLGIEVITGAEGWKRFDHLLEHQSQSIRYAFVSRIGVAEKFTWHLKKLNCPRSIYIHDIDALRGFHHDPNAPGYEALVEAAIAKYAARHRMLFSLFDHIVSLSEHETRLLQPHFGNKLVDVFPYDFPSIEETDDRVERNDLIFVGSYNHPPNREAIANFIENIWPGVLKRLPVARLHLCGYGFESADFRAAPNVVRHGTVSDRTLAYLYSISRVSIAPLLTGAGMKGKVIESFAHGVPCVGTDVAWHGIALPQAFAHLSGSLSSFEERLLETYEAHSYETASQLLTIYNDWRGQNKMSDVLRNLISPALYG